MTIKDVEERTGLSRSNVRFYEKEKLIEPSRNESNGYRDYSENDVENIKKIVILSILVDTFISKISFPMQPGPEIGSISDA